MKAILIAILATIALSAQAETCVPQKNPDGTVTIKLYNGKGAVVFSQDAKPEKTNNINRDAIVVPHRALTQMRRRGAKHEKIRLDFLEERYPTKMIQRDQTYVEYLVRHPLDRVAISFGGCKVSSHNMVSKPDEKRITDIVFDVNLLSNKTLLSNIVE
jgi:hypothetical protein